MADKKNKKVEVVETPAVSTTAAPIEKIVKEAVVEEAVVEEAVVEETVVEEAVVEETVVAGAVVVLNPTQLRQQEASKLRAENKAKAEKANKATADKKADNAAIAEKTAKNSEKDNRKVFKDDRGQRFRFKKSAPKALNIDGVSTSIDEIIDDEEIMLELVNGNSNYLEQIH